MSDTLSKNAVGSPADGVKMPADSTGAGYTVSSIVPVTVKQVDYKNLKTGEDFRAIGAQPNPLAGNDTPVRGETTENENAGA